MGRISHDTPSGTGTAKRNAGTGHKKASAGSGGDGSAKKKHRSLCNKVVVSKHLNTLMRKAATDAYSSAWRAAAMTRRGAGGVRPYTRARTMQVLHMTTPNVKISPLARQMMTEIVVQEVDRQVSRTIETTVNNMTPGVRRPQLLPRYYITQQLLDSSSGYV